MIIDSNMELRIISVGEYKDFERPLNRLLREGYCLDTDTFKLSGASRYVAIMYKHVQRASNQ
jgi:hypothetical protein